MSKQLMPWRLPMKVSDFEVSRLDISEMEILARREFSELVSDERENQIRTYGSDVASEKSFGVMMAVLLRAVSDLQMTASIADTDMSIDDIDEAVYQQTVRLGAVVSAIYERQRVGISAGVFATVAHQTMLDDPWLCDS